MSACHYPILVDEKKFGNVCLKTKLAEDVDLDVLARGTTGMSGADLFNSMNQAAVKASAKGLNAINMAVLEYAKDKILMGAQRTSAVISDETKNVPLITKRDMHSLPP
jgi:ATP-dependent Zn protease